MCHTTWRRAYILDTFIKSGFEPEMLDLQSNALPFGYSPYSEVKLLHVSTVGGDGVEPPETEATRFTVWPATPTVYPPISIPEM